MHELPSIEIYIESVYFTIITLSTIGYGDIIPVTPQEKILVIFYALIGSIMMGYNINMIGNLIDQLGERERTFKSKMRKVE